jgi:hypothetical protein
MSLVLDKLIDITQKELIKTKCCWKTKKTIEIQQQRAGEGLTIHWRMNNANWGKGIGFVEA